MLCAVKVTAALVSEVKLSAAVTVAPARIIVLSQILSSLFATAGLAGVVVVVALEVAAMFDMAPVGHTLPSTNSREAATIYPRVRRYLLKQNQNKAYLC